PQIRDTHFQCSYVLSGKHFCFKSFPMYYKRFLLLVFFALSTITVCLAQKNFKNYKPYSNISPQNIDIVRDSFGIPHIFAKTDAEVAYGLAWATAEDDFKTIQQGFFAGKSMMGLSTGKQ